MIDLIELKGVPVFRLPKEILHFELRPPATRWQEDLTLRRSGWRFWQTNKKIWVAAHVWPQEMSPDKMLRSGRRRSKSGKRKARGSRFCGQHEPGFSASRISGKLRRFGWPCPELKKIYPALTLRQVNCVPSLASSTQCRSKIVNRICESFHLSCSSDMAALPGGNA